MTRSEKNFDSTAQRRVRTYRRWSVMQKREIVAQTYQAGESVLTVARRYEVGANQVSRWRREFKNAGGHKEIVQVIAPVNFIPVEIVNREAEPSAMATTLPPGTMTIMLREGMSLRVDREVDDRALRRVLAVMAEMV